MKTYIKKLSLEEFDYSVEAKREHKSILRHQNRVKRAIKNGCDTVEITYEQAKKNLDKNKRTTILRTLKTTFRSITLEERRGMWNEVKILLDAFGYEISFSDLRAMYKIWQEKGIKVKQEVA